ncbi:MAG: hypothetical protein CL930_11805 [Deltaproteobacteria bacterium]|nr:hypothetical protein [Deltaproteobacteria bacterium]
MKSIWAVLLGVTLMAGPAKADVPQGQEQLNTWWSASKKMWIGQDAYKADGAEFTDGLCSAQLNEGVIIPVYTGVKPLSERVVGILFVGKGDLEVGFPRRADAWSFANHMVRKGEKSKDEMNPIAREGASYKTEINRALILSANPAVEEMLLNRMPVGSGVYRTATEDGVDEEYVVTESRGKISAKMVTTNMLPQRTLLLEKAGLDPVAMLRQDRLLHEELGFPGEHLRSIADFRTVDRFRVASSQGAGVGPTAYDKWLTCFRDGLGQSDLGGESMVFTHGQDVDGVRHTQRFSGKDFDQGPEDVVPRPKVMMEPVLAESTVDIKPVQRRNYMQVVVESVLTIKASGSPLQHVALALPTERSSPSNFELLALEDMDGQPLARVGLHTDTAFFAKGRGSTDDAAQSTAVDEGAEAAGISEESLPTVNPQGLGLGGGGGGDTSSVGPTGSEDAAGLDTDEVGGSIEMQTVSSSIPDYELVSETPFKYELLVLLDEPVPEGETTQIRVKWKTKWKYSNMTFSGRQLGPTTGARRFLPELLPAPGGTSWATKTTLTLPPDRFFPMGGAITGDTISDVTSDDGWRTVMTESDGSLLPSVGVGKWLTHSEEKAANLPSVRVHLMTSDAFGLGEFPPEVRRIVSFMQRFLPSLGMDEIEVFQGAAMLPAQALAEDFHYGRPGLVQTRNIKTTDVGSNTGLKEAYPALTQTLLATQVAHQYWGQSMQPNSSADEWLLEALSDAYGAFYIRAGLGKDTWQGRIDGVRKRVEDPTDRGESDNVYRERRPLSLTEPQKFTDIRRAPRADYGFLLMAQTLRDRIGGPSYFMALDRLARRRMGGRVTTDDLQAVFEETSGQDLSDFFDFWIRGGHIPELHLKYKLIEDGELTAVEACIESDQPFGSFDVPVRVSDSMGPVEALVDVDDGLGAFQVPGRKGELTVEVDPDIKMVLYGRTVTQVGADEPLACIAKDSESEETDKKGRKNKKSD